MTSNDSRSQTIASRLKRLKQFGTIPNHRVSDVDHDGVRLQPSHLGVSVEAPAPDSSVATPRQHYN